MSKPDVIDLLNQLLAIEYRSLPTYLAQTSLWSRQGDEQVRRAVEHIATDQQLMSRRVAEAVLDLGGTLDLGEFPMAFTDTHDLSLDFMVSELVGYQRVDIARIERIVESLAGQRDAQQLAQEVLGTERAHLETLEALAAQPA